MANVNKLISDASEFTGNAQPGDVVQGKSFYSDSETKQTGTLAPRQWGNGKGIVVWNGGFYIQNIEEGLYRGGGPNQPEARVDANLLGNATPSDVASGKTFSSFCGAKIVGTKPEKHLNSITMGSTGFGSFSFTLNKHYNECIIVLSTATNGAGDIPPRVVASSGTLQRISVYDTKPSYSLWTAVSVYKGSNISGTLSCNAGYSLAVTIIEMV